MVVQGGDACFLKVFPGCHPPLFKTQIQNAMKTTKGILRNFTTGRLHTDIGEVYKFIEQYTGEPGIMTHHLVSACQPIQFLLKRHLSEDYFDGQWIKDGLDEVVEIPDPTREELAAFWQMFNGKAEEVWNAIKDKMITCTTTVNTQTTNSTILWKPDTIRK